jgi:hypothetical protein
MSASFDQGFLAIGGVKTLFIIMRQDVGKGRVAQRCGLGFAAKTDAV